MWGTSQPRGQSAKLSIRTLKSIPSCRYLRFMSSFITRAALTSILSLISAGSAFAGPSTKFHFDGVKALTLLEELTAFGQRYPGPLSATRRLRSRRLSCAGPGRPSSYRGSTRRLQSMESLIHSPISSEGSTQNVPGESYLGHTLIPGKLLTSMRFRNVARHRLQVRTMGPVGLLFSSNWQPTCLRFFKTSGLVLISSSLMLKISEPARTSQALVEVPNIMLNN